MIINGKELSQDILNECKNQLVNYPKRQLVVVTIGDDPASKVYVRNKQKAAEQIGLEFNNIRFSEEEDFNFIYYSLLNLIYTNGYSSQEVNPSLAGMIIQLPIVSKTLNEKQKKTIIDIVPDCLDVDGFNLTSEFIPCTPKGILYMLRSIPNYSLRGKTALVIGRSNIVGKPIAKLLLNEDCTVIQAHSKTPKNTLLRMFAYADVVISAVGRANLITEEDAIQYFKDNRHEYYSGFEVNKDNRIIIDVGMNRDENGKLCGDLSESFKEAYSKYYSPVPGGVGPMTVAMLMDNAKEAICRS